MEEHKLKFSDLVNKMPTFNFANLYQNLSNSLLMYHVNELRK